jgi:adenosine kinase
LGRNHVHSGHRVDGDRPHHGLPGSFQEPHPPHVPELKQFFGGTAGKIAYGLRLLGDEPLILAAVGSDFDAYADWLDQSGLRRDGIRVFDDAYTAQAFITTDLDDNQIIAFHPGAMERSAEVGLDLISDPIEWAVVSSNDKTAMQQYAAELKRRGVHTMIDPSHQLPVFQREELVEFIDGAEIYVANDYEWALTLDQTGMSEEVLVGRVGAAVITRGALGSIICHGGERIDIPPVKAKEVVDPTGCGDAYRAGLLYALTRGWSFEIAGRIGSVMGALNVEQRGPQTLRVGIDAVRARYAEAYGDPF